MTYKQEKLIENYIRKVVISEITKKNRLNEGFDRRAFLTNLANKLNLRITKPNTLDLRDDKEANKLKQFLINDRWNNSKSNKDRFWKTIDGLTYQFAVDSFGGHASFFWNTFEK